MREQIFEFVNQYAVWGILLTGLLMLFVLFGVHRQLKKLNRSLSAMTRKLQEYFTAIVEEEQPEEQPISTREKENTEDVHIKKEERVNAKANVKKMEDEAVIHAVLKEYLS